MLWFLPKVVFQKGLSVLILFGLISHTSAEWNCAPKLRLVYDLFWSIPPLIGNQRRRWKIEQDGKILYFWHWHKRKMAKDIYSFSLALLNLCIMTPSAGRYAKCVHNILSIFFLSEIMIIAWGMLMVDILDNWIIQYNELRIMFFMN